MRHALGCNSRGMKPSARFTLAFLALTLLVCHAQTAPNQFVGGGAFFCQDCAPQVNGAIFYMKQVAGSNHPTYAYNAVNILSVQRDSITRRFSVITTPESGVVQHMTRIGPFDLLAGAAPGIATAGNTSGTNVGFSLAAPVLALADLGRGFRGGPCFRAAKSTIDSGQWSIGFVVVSRPPRRYRPGACVEFLCDLLGEAQTTHG